MSSAKYRHMEGNIDKLGRFWVALLKQEETQAPPTSSLHCLGIAKSPALLGWTLQPRRSETPAVWGRGRKERRLPPLPLRNLMQAQLESLILGALSHLRARLSLASASSESFKAVMTMF